MTKPREENAVERIKRINFEFGQTKERPKHLDDKNIYSYEERFEKNSKNINNKKIAKKPKPNGQTTFTSDDWDLLINSPTDFPYEIFDDKKVELDGIYELYLDLLKKGELLPGTTFQMFEKNYLDFDTDVFTKIKKRVNEMKKAEGLAALLSDSPGRIKTMEIINNGNKRYKI